LGVPARQVGWMSRFGERVPLPLEGDGSYRCPHSGTHYKLVGDNLIAESP
jgi:UDP-2-acetamido-3-amino-2,3-dideoxy-glucuronate N-acetyltransferase